LNPPLNIIPRKIKTDTNSFAIIDVYLKNQTGYLGAMNKANNSIDVSNLNNGVYMFKTTDGKQQATFVKE
jgi:hypothetical protein